MPDYHVMVKKRRRWHLADFMVSADTAHKAREMAMFTLDAEADKVKVEKASP